MDSGSTPFNLPNFEYFDEVTPNPPTPGSSRPEEDKNLGGSSDSNGTVTDDGFPPVF